MSGGPDLRRLAGRAVIGPHDPSPEGAEVLVERGHRRGRRGDGHVTDRRGILAGRTAADRLPEAPPHAIGARPPAPPRAPAPRAGAAVGPGGGGWHGSVHWGSRRLYRGGERRSRGRR